MSTISAIGGGSWAARSMPDANAMRQRMFSKVDSDGGGSVDQTELQTMLDKMSERSGKDVGSASDLMAQWDGDGSGNLSSDELDTGMRSLMPAPSSTMEFAQMRGQGGEGVGMGAMPPPGGACDNEASASGTGSDTASSSSSSTDDADTNGDGTVSAGERAAAELKKLVETLTQAMDGNGDQSLGLDEVSSFLARLQTSIDAMA